MTRAIQAVIFDMDGTITVPVLDFPLIKTEIGLRLDEGLLEGLSRLDERGRVEAEEILLRHELAAAGRSVLNEGVAEALVSLSDMGMKMAILTRNCRAAVDIVLSRHCLSFDAVVTREDSLPKPDPDGVHSAAEKMSVPSDACVMVGDFEFDIKAGRAAGSVTVLYAPTGHDFQTAPDFEIRSMAELPGIVESLLGE